jgi:type IX secretion system PorP/SprF family membrane protein
MRTMRRLSIILLALAAVPGLRAQQLPQLSQYVSQDYLYNPAVAGSRPWFELRSAHRNQWVGIQDAPRTFMMSATTPIAANMGLGGFIYTDNVGPTRRTGVQFSYAYHLRFNDRIRMGLSVAFGAQQFLIDGSKITFRQTGDPAMDDQLRGSLMPDATFGMQVYHDNWWVGAAAPQLLNNRIVFYDDQAQSMSRLENHYYAMGGYRFRFGDDLRLEPSFLLKYVEPVPAKLDLTATVYYKDMLWLGGTYRTNDAVALIVGCWLKKRFQFGYSFDVTTTNIARYSTGTHEVMLAFTFGKTPVTRAPTTGAATPTPAP